MAGTSQEETFYRTLDDATEVIDYVFCIAPDLVEQSGARGMLPVQTDEIGPGYLGYTALVARVATLAENR